MFIRAFFAAHGGYFGVTGLYQALNTALMFVNPILIHTIVSYLAGTTQMSNTAAIMVAM